MSRPVFRFAPSPNGRLHLGHAYSALTAYEAARALGGRFLLRLEDIDIGRCRPDYADGIFEDLAWLGLEWEEPVRRQSEHFDDYAAALARLDAAGLLYPCFATRGEIAAAVARHEAAGAVWPRDPDGAPLYPGLHRGLGPAERAAHAGTRRPALRLKMDEALARAGAGLTWRELGDAADMADKVRTVAARPERWGDVVLARREVPTSYHLAVVVDDALQGVTHVVRGRDLYQATAVHRLLQRLLGLPEPVYRHHRLVLDAEGRKLSKSAGDTALRELRAAGATPAGIRRMVGLGPPA